MNPTPLNSPFRLALLPAALLVAAFAGCEIHNYEGFPHDGSGCTRPDDGCNNPPPASNDRCNTHADCRGASACVDNVCHPICQSNLD
ncbi:MAG: hypothetical protein ACK4N5_20480, partial [Myxococcales bacterium]